MSNSRRHNIIELRGSVPEPGAENSSPAGDCQAAAAVPPQAESVDGRAVHSMPLLSRLRQSETSYRRTLFRR